MPIASDNNLPHTSLLLGSDRKGPSLSVLYDTGATLTSGYLPHHQHIRRTCPSLVHSYEEFDGSNPFDPIKLEGAISTAAEYNPQTHGVLSAVIRYFTPYQDREGKQLLLPLALGNHMAVNTILGNTVIRKFQMCLEFNPDLVRCTALQETFDIMYEPTKISDYEDITSTTDNINEMSDPSSDLSIFDTYVFPSPKAKSWG